MYVKVVEVNKGFRSDEDLVKLAGEGRGLLAFGKWGGAEPTHYSV